MAFQVVFNEALTKVVAEKDKKIDELQEKEATLQADSDKYRSKSSFADSFLHFYPFKAFSRLALCIGQRLCSNPICRRLLLFCTEAMSQCRKKNGSRNSFHWRALFVLLQEATPWCENGFLLCSLLDFPLPGQLSDVLSGKSTEDEERQMALNLAQDRLQQIKCVHTQFQFLSPLCHHWVQNLHFKHQT